jgi:hypothetical protein
MRRLSQAKRKSTVSRTRFRLLQYQTMAFVGLAYLLPSTVSAQPGAPVAFAWQESIKGDKEPEILLRWPIAIATASDLEFGVLDAWKARFLVFKDEGTRGWKPKQPVELPAPPSGLAFDGDRYLVTLRGTGALVAIERPELEIRRISLPPDVSPGAIAAKPEVGYLLFDSAGNRLIRFSPDDQNLLQVPIDGYVTAVAFDASGGFLAAIATPPEIRRFGANGEMTTSWSVPSIGAAPAWPVGLDADAGGDLIIADRHTGQILILDAGGKLVGLGARQGWDAGLLLRPADISRFPDGRIVVADQGNGRVQIFSQLRQDASP